MSPPESTRPAAEEPSWLHPVDLFLRCASDRGDSGAWSEFLRRYSVKIKFFVRGTLRQDFGSSNDPDNVAAPGGIQESDFFQNTILRLVENDCAAMKRFSGSTENELLAYLAVISRCVVRDTLRKHKALKRRGVAADLEAAATRTAASSKLVDDWGFEREVLAREILSLTQHTIRSLSGQSSSRDQLVFDLHFSHGLSFKQIAECKGINLSKAGVEKLLNRLVGRVRALASAGKSEGTLE